MCTEKERKTFNRRSLVVHQLNVACRIDGGVHADQRSSLVGQAHIHRVQAEAGQLPYLGFKFNQVFAAVQGWLFGLVQILFGLVEGGLLVQIDHLFLWVDHGVLADRKVCGLLHLQCLLLLQLLAE